MNLKNKENQEGKIVIFCFLIIKRRFLSKLAIKKLTSLNIRIPIFAKIDAQVKRNEWDIIVQHLTPFVDVFIGTSEQINPCVDKSVICLERSFYVSFSTDEINKKKLEIGKLIQHTCIGGIVVNAPVELRTAIGMKLQMPMNA